MRLMFQKHTDDRGSPYDTTSNLPHQVARVQGGGAHLLEEGNQQ
jgi:hypothetical protein